MIWATDDTDGKDFTRIELKKICWICEICVKNIARRFCRFAKIKYRSDTKDFMQIEIKNYTVKNSRESVPSVLSVPKKTLRT